MWAYYVNNSIRGIKRSPWLSFLMVLAIAVGIGVFMTTYTVFHYMSSNPIAHKSEQLYKVRLDNWDPDGGWDEPNLPPNQLTYQDARFLAEAAPGDLKTAMFTAHMTVIPDDRAIKPINQMGRLVYSDFFAMFEPEFLHGGPWTRSQDSSKSRIIVLSRELNERLFGDRNSIGETLRLNDDYYEVVGVLDHFHPKPKYFDLANFADFGEMEDFYIPFTVNDYLQTRSAGNNSCWMDPPDPTYDGYLRSECIWVNFWVQIENPKDAQAYLDFLNNYVTDQKTLGRFPRPLNNRLDNVDQWLAENEVVSDDVYIQLGLSSAFLLVCLVNTVGLMLAKFLSNSGEIGVRRALGASKKQIFNQYIVESAIIGAAGAAIGAGLSWLGLWATRSLASEIAGLTQLNLELLVTALLMALITSVAAGIYPTWRACQIPPATQLKSQ